VTGGTIQGSNTNNSINVLWNAAGTGSVNVTQTSAFGCDSAMSKTVTIMPTPAPVMSGPDSTCSNKIYTYSVPAVIGNSYNWIVTGGSFVGSNTASTVRVQWGSMGVGLISIIQTSAFGCDSTIGKVVTIMPTPAPVITGLDSVCEFKSNFYTVPLISGITYDWVVSGGTVIGSTNTNQIQVLWADAGIGVVSIKETSTFGCDSIINLNVKIMPTPQPVISGPDSVCSNRIYTYNVTTPFGYANIWSVSGGQILGANNLNSVTVKWGGFSPGNVFVTQSSASGCDSTVSYYVEILPTPDPVVSGSSPVCQYKTYEYSVITTPNHTYHWSVNGGVIVSNPDSSVIFVRWTSPGNATVTVNEVSEFGCDSALTTPILVNPTPTPFIVGPDSTCETKVYSYLVTAISGHSYQWTVSNGTIIGSPNGSTVQVKWGTAGIGRLNIRQISGFGCDSNVNIDITIMPMPKPVIAGPLATCETKTYNYSTPMVAGHSYTWFVTGGTIMGPDSNNTVNVKWNVAGGGAINVLETSEFGCGTIASNNITIQPTPVPVIGGPDSICWKNISTYYAGKVNMMKSWNIVGGRIIGPSVLDSVKVTWDSIPVGIVELKLTNAFGCDSTVQKFVNLLRFPQLIISGPSVMCLSHEDYFYTDGYANTVYTWTAPGGVFTNPSTQNITSIRYDMPGKYKIHLDYKAGNGCAGFADKAVQVFGFPKPQINGRVKACAYSDGNLNDENTYSVKKTTADSLVYTWKVSNPASYIQTSNNAINVDWGGPGRYRIAIYQVNPMTGCQDSSEFFVDVDSLPHPKIDPSSMMGCAPLTVTFSESTGNPNYICNWHFDNGNAMNKASVTRTFANIGNNNVKLVVTNEYGCVDSTTMIVPLYARPKASFDILDPDPIYTTDTVHFKNTSTGAVDYFWDLDMGDYSYNTDTMKQYPDPGKYKVWLWAYNASGCADSVSKIVDIRVKPWIYVPNAFTPNGDGLNDVFGVKSKYIESFDLMLYNRWGEIIYKTQDINFEWDATYLSKEVPSGVYVYVIFGRDYYGKSVYLKGDVNVLR
ncbi:MAG: gliding motility-associated C-terminal domain-containing protein, partial [Bacteroidetes bacterium]|nr:gliding motility-associated C-terminal domain-containing protein [Bacteroidota bacterium]